MRFVEEEVLQSLQPQSDPVAQQRALDYLNQLKHSEVGWQICMDTLTSNSTQDDRLKFFCLQVIEHFTKHHYADASLPHQQKMRQFLSQWVQMQTSGSTAVFLRNKAAQIFSLVFVQDYPGRWPSFFTDLIDTLSLGHMAADTYVRVLKAVHIEVVDIEVLHTPQEVQRNNAIKTAMREAAVDQLVESWYQILTVYQPYGEVVCQCLEVIGAYVSWINIVLVANTRFIDLLLGLMSQSVADVKEAAVDCLYEVISKGMEPMAKLELIETLMPMLAHIMDPIKDDESEFTCKLSRLVNGIGLNLIEGQKLLCKGGTPEQVQMVQCAIERKIPLVITFLGNDYDDVSQAVIDFAREYVHMLKARSLMTESQLNNVHNILVTIARKMQFDESYRFDHEGEDEATFLEYRKLLKVLFENVAGLNKDLVLEFTNKYVSAILQDWQSSPFQEIEVAISLVYYIGEVPGVLSEQFVCPEEHTGSIPVLQQMMTTLVTCGVSQHPHPTVALQYLETVVRYDKFFVADPQHLPAVLLAFLDQRGMRHNSCKVRSRCAFLFSRFVKTLKNYLQPYTEHVLLPLQDLLVLSSPMNGCLVSQDDQLFLYEAAAILIVSSSYAPHQKGAAFGVLLRPVLDKFSGLVRQIGLETDQGRIQHLAEYLCHAMAVTSRTSKAFTNHQSMKASGCTLVFLETVQAFLSCLQVDGPNEEATATLQAGVRQFLHRMVVCLEDDLLPFIPQASQGLLKNSGIQSIQEYLPLIVQIITKFKKEVLPFLQQVFKPMVNAIFLYLAAPIEENDEQAKRERQMLQRSYFTFMAAIVTSDVIDVLKAQPDSMFVEQVLMSIIRGAVDYPDPIAQKTCFTILRQLVNIWGDTDGETKGFTQFIYKNIVPACFMAPMKITFDLSDAQTLVALAESALCIKTIHLKRGEELVSYLRTDYLPTLHLSPQHIDRYCQQITLDNKTFKMFVKQFFQQAKT